MSTLKNPVGPEAGRTYRRRRLVFLLGLVAVIVVILLIVVRPGGGTADAKDAGPGAASSPSTTESSQTPPPSGAPCAPEKIVVQAITDSNSYGSGELPQLSLSVTNTGKSACTIQGGTADQLYTITSGSETYWKSTDCQKDPQHTKVLLSPGKTITSDSLTWDRTRSDPSTCGAQRPAVAADGASYHLKVEIGGVTSKDTKQFLLH